MRTLTIVLSFSLRALPYFDYCLNQPPGASLQTGNGSEDSYGPFAPCRIAVLENGGGERVRNTQSYSAHPDCGLGEWRRGLIKIRALRFISRNQIARATY
ncbi:MAG: hypothetical protein JXA30_12230, partial [Deltaproteobacteria bacterium]|nr:hypothetical protein [Deltaproteobacteria bacterium]